VAYVFVKEERRDGATWQWVPVERDLLPLKKRSALVALILVLSLAFCSAAVAGNRAKNVIVLIADGCSDEQDTFARWFKGEALSFDPIRVGLSRPTSPIP